MAERSDRENDATLGGFVSLLKQGYTPPWDGNNKSDHYDEEKFWAPIKIDPSRWNRLYPYRLLVVDVSNGNYKTVSESTWPAFGEVSSKKDGNGESGIEYTITQVAGSKKWECVLPITPQQLTITDQYAINTSSTMRGVVEEHNGLRFKNITINGTTGIWPRRPTKAATISNPSSFGSIFGGTIDAFNQLSSSVSSFSSIFSGKHPKSPGPKASRPWDEEQKHLTGYYQALYLGQFLERYSQAKKNPKYKGWRLVLDIPKRNLSYVVTPVSFTSNQSHQRPNEYLFNIQLKAWKKINLDEAIDAAASELPKLEANYFQRLLRTIDQTRSTLSSATNLIKAVRGNIENPGGIFDILRQTSLAIKDANGALFSAADLAKDITNKNFFKSIFEQAWGELKTQGQGIINLSRLKTPGGGGGNSNGIYIKSAISTKATSSVERASAAVSSIIEKNKSFEGISSEAVAAGALGSAAAESLQTNPINSIYENPEENFDLFNEISLDSLNLTVEQQQAFDDELEKIRLITVNDFRVFRQQTLDLALDISNTFGAGNSTYAAIYGRQAPKERVSDLTIEENEILLSLYEAVQVFDALIASKQWDNDKIESPLEFIGGLANEAGIDFDRSVSKILTPVPFNLTIEEIAARYLGDANKWIEIATINNLKSPYIDEDGFTINFLSNGEGRQFNISDTENRLFLGQKITLQSDLIPPFSRKILDIEKIDDNNILITVDGDGDLNNLKFSENARMKGYLPGTVNSQNQIYIPTNLASEEDDEIFDVPRLKPDNLTKLSKIDFLLTEDQDVALDSVGDFRLANGLTNLIQSMKLKIITKKGTLLRHMNYGLGIRHGVSVADIENGAILNSLNAMIEEDSRFSSIDRAEINLLGSTLKITMSISLTNNRGVLPVTFVVPA